MEYYDLYGFRSDDLDSIRDVIEDTLQVKFQARESLYIGDYYSYRFSGEKHGHITLRRNLDPLDGEPAELEFPDFTILLYSENVDSPLMFEERIVMQIPEVSLLRRKILPEG